MGFWAGDRYKIFEMYQFCKARSGIYQSKCLNHVNINKHYIPENSLK